MLADEEVGGCSGWSAWRGFAIFSVGDHVAFPEADVINAQDHVCFRESDVIFGPRAW
ncbi:hypothetical protein F4553_005858 [Allocatelliglobosispora scoriae]|uniref:Uncharacterized protein n=1 Tax=Allocatelliglobosispora scoriae TaxID=643052 RepID=A0A841BW93_9ACTN|nr:hypothetical protein [Allocatelliglobosispora scoriae]MBB5872424.1 hypothetical protein [Allocatelliglobosispora scoriae]